VCAAMERDARRARVAATLYAKNEQLEKQQKLTCAAQCVICFGAEPVVACVPCGHMAACDGCSPNVATQCPTCRRSVERLCRMYMP
jgi:hypothetical protein